MTQMSLMKKLVLLMDEVMDLEKKLFQCQRDIKYYRGKAEARWEKLSQLEPEDKELKVYKMKYEVAVKEKDRLEREIEKLTSYKQKFWEQNQMEFEVNKRSSYKRKFKAEIKKPTKMEHEVGKLQLELRRSRRNRRSQLKEENWAAGVELEEEAQEEMEEVHEVAMEEAPNQETVIVAMMNTARDRDQEVVMVNEAESLESDGGVAEEGIPVAKVPKSEGGVAEDSKDEGMVVKIACDTTATVGKSEVVKQNANRCRTWPTLMTGDGKKHGRCHDSVTKGGLNCVNNMCICGYWSCREDWMKAHVIRGMFGSVFKCREDGCGESFAELQVLKNHTFLTHDIEYLDTFGCSFCGEMFEESDELEEHDNICSRKKIVDTAMM